MHPRVNCNDATSSSHSWRNWKLFWQWYNTFNCQLSLTLYHKALREGTPGISMAMAAVPQVVRWQSSNGHQLFSRPRCSKTLGASPVGDAKFLTTCFGSLACFTLRSLRRSKSTLKALATQVASKGSVVAEDSVAKDGDITWQRYSQQGAARAAAGDHDAAFEAARKCLEEVDTKSLDYAKILMNIGVIHAETGRYPVALESYELAKELFVGLKRLKSKNGARLLGNIAVAKSKTAMDSNPNWEEVVSAFTTALQMFQQQGLMRSKEGVRLLIQAGQAKEETGNFADALEDYKAARATLEEAGAIGSKMGIEVLEKMSGWVVIYGGSFFPVLQCTWHCKDHPQLALVWYIMILSKTLDVSPDSLPPEIFPNYLCFCTREFPPSARRCPIRIRWLGRCRGESGHGRWEDGCQGPPGFLGRSEDFAEVGGSSNRAQWLPGLIFLG